MTEKKNKGFEYEIKLQAANQQLKATEQYLRANEQNLIQQNEFLNSILESVSYPFYVIDADNYTVKLANSAADFDPLSQDLTCYALTYNTSRPCCDVERRCPLKEVKKTKKPVIMEHIHYDKNGQVRNVEVYAHPIFDSKGNVSQIIKCHIDITNRKKAEKEKEDLAKFPSENPNPVLRITKDGKILYSNEASEQLLSKWSCEVGKKVPEKWRNLIVEAFASEKGTAAEEEVKDKVFLITIAPIKDTGYANIYASDITKRKKIENSLQNSEANLIKAQEVAHIGSWNLDLLTNKIVWTDENYRIFGIPNGTPMTYEKFLEVVHPEDRDYVNEKWNAATEGEPCYIEHRLLIGNEIKWAREKAELIFDDMGKPIGGVGITQDITSQKLAEEEIIEKQKQLQALATQLLLSEESERRRIAEGLHDDIIQPLTFLDVKLKTFLDSEVNSKLTNSYKRMRKIIRKLINDVHDFTFDLSYPVLYELGFEKAIKQWLNSKIKEKHGLKIIFKDDRRSKPLSDNMQIFLFKWTKELLVNVVKHAKATKVEISLAKDRDNIVVCVKDNGIGFSVKKTAGFGLLNIHDRIDHLGGCFEIESKRGCGTKVIITLPLKREEAI